MNRVAHVFHAGPWHVLLVSEHICNMFARIELACWRVFAGL